MYAEISERIQLVAKEKEKTLLAQIYPNPELLNLHRVKMMLTTIY